MNNDKFSSFSEFIIFGDKDTDEPYANIAYVFDEEVENDINKGIGMQRDLAEKIRTQFPEWNVQIEKEGLFVYWTDLLEKFFDEEDDIYFKEYDKLWEKLLKFLEEELGETGT